MPGLTPKLSLDKAPGRSLLTGQDGIFLAFGTMFIDCVKAAEKLRSDGLDVGVVNARFLRPLDIDPIVQTIG